MKHSVFLICHTPVVTTEDSLVSQPESSVEVVWSVCIEKIPVLL
jgi:hypothetical protein